MRIGYHRDTGASTTERGAARKLLKCPLAGASEIDGQTEQVPTPEVDALPRVG